MKHAATRELFAYWNALRGERTAPERSEIEPTVIRNVLADTFMLDLDKARGFPFRLAGTRVNGLFDAEQKGRSFLDLWRPEERRNMAAVLLTVADGAVPVVVGSHAAPSRKHEGCHLELLFLPLRHFGKTHERLLGIVTPAAQPSWLGLMPAGPLALRSLRIVETARAAKRTTDAVAVPPRGRFVPDRDDPPHLPILGGLLRGGRPTLRVIEGGRPSR